MKKSFALALALTLFAASTTGAPTQKKTKANLAADQSLAYATTPFDVNSEALPNHYLGHSCSDIAKAVLSLNPMKDEYETTAAFQERIAKLATRPLIGSVMLGGYLAFLEEDPSVTSQYNADTETLWIGGHPSSGKIFVNSSPITSVLITSKVTSQSTYSASNAYGKIVDVKKSHLNSCALAFPQFGSPIKFSDYKTSVTMPPTEARNTKDNIGVLYIGRLSQPYWVKYSDYLKPTIDSPHEAYWSGDTLIMDDIQVWLFNKASGRILQKITF
jgi:hypothetical protein